MSEIKCIIGKDNLPGTVCETKTTEEKLSSKFRYICKNHSRAVQVRANGRNYDPVKDEYDKGLHFQDVQFDKDLVRAARPQGTSHIHRQGQAHDCEKSPEGTPNQP